MKRAHEDMVGDDYEDNGDDNSDGVDESCRIPPYDATKEKPPSSPVFTEGYTKLKNSISNMVHLLKEPLVGSPYRNDVINGLLDEIQKRTNSEFPEEVRIALIGDMKSGKSSVINSLLSVGMIARQGDAGTSCTWVVNEFCYLFPNQTQAFAAEVHFFTQQERYDIIKALFADYYRASPKDDDAANGPKDSEQTIEDFGIMRNTVAAFRAMFCDHKEFADHASATDFLTSADSEDDEDILETLYNWIDERMSHLSPKENYATAEANTPQGLLLTLAPFQHTVEERGGELSVSLWPIVSRIRFGLECPLLKNNISLVDLPGLSDANKTRVSNAVSNLRTCTHYMIVAEIGRAEDDKFIREHLTRGFETRGSGRTMLVLTHADTIDEATEVHGTTKDQQALNKLTNEMKSLERKKSEMVGRIKTSTGMQRYEFMDARDKIANDLRDKSARYHEHRIAMRSRAVDTQMRDFYTDLTNDPRPLPVFCVGNAAYRKHQAGYMHDDPNPPTLSVLGTNIPALRQHLFLAPAEGRLNEVRHQVATQLPTLISCFKLYVSKTHMARKGEVEAMITEPQAEVAKYIEKLFDGLSEVADLKILTPICQDEHEWVEEARNFCRQWAKMYSTSIHFNFLKKDGLRKGKGKNSTGISWNNDLVSIQAGQIRLYFGNFMESLDKIGKEATREVHRLVSSITRKIKDDPQVTLMALKPFLDYLYNEKGNIARFIDVPTRHLRKDIGVLSMSAITEEINNPIVQAMAPIYAEARTIKSPKKSPKDRVLFFEKKVTRMGDGVWIKAHDHLRKEIEDVLDKYSNHFRMVIMEFLIGIEKRFNMMCADKELETEEETAIREKLSKNLILAKEVFEKEIQPAAKACFGD